MELIKSERNFEGGKMDKLIMDKCTIKQMIKLLLEEPMDNLIVFRQGQKKLKNVKVCSKEPEQGAGLGELFG